MEKGYTIDAIADPIPHNYPLAEVLGDGWAKSFKDMTFILFLPPAPAAPASNDNEEDQPMDAEDDVVVELHEGP